MSASAADIRRVLLMLILPVLVPVGLGAALKHFGSGPDVYRIMADMKSPEKAVRQNAAEWAAGMRLPSLLPAVAPLLDDPERAVQRRAIDAVSRSRDPRGAFYLEKAFWRNPGRQESIVRAIGYIYHPFGQEALWPIIRGSEKWHDMAVEWMRISLEVVNFDGAYYSIRRRIANKHGHMIYSLASLFPEARAMAWGHQPDLAERDKALREQEEEFRRLFKAKRARDEERQ